MLLFLFFKNGSFILKWIACEFNPTREVLMLVNSVFIWIMSVSKMHLSKSYIILIGTLTLEFILLAIFLIIYI